MKLYYSPGACSLATRIVLHEAGFEAHFERVDLKAKVTETGADYGAINPAGSVPLLVLDDGAAVTENVAILDLMAELAPQLGVGGPLGRTRLVEMLSFLSTELHIAFKPFWHPDGDRTAAAEAVKKRLDLLEARLVGPYRVGDGFTGADAYLFVMLRWAQAFHVPLPPKLEAFFDHVGHRGAVQRALAEEA